MKKSIFRLILLLGIGLLSCFSYSQEYNSFNVCYQSNLRSNLIFIGNNILNRDSGTAGEDHNLPSGDYWYVIKLQGESDDREFVGHFTLYR